VRCGVCRAPLYVRGYAVKVYRDDSGRELSRRKCPRYHPCPRLNDLEAHPARAPRLQPPPYNPLTFYPAAGVDYTVSDARYAKGQRLVRCPSKTSFKSRAARLLGNGLRARWTNRESGYVTSPGKLKKFEELYAEGWDASTMTGVLLPPSVNPKP
jgi:hypothetical protein